MRNRLLSALRRASQTALALLRRAARLPGRINTRRMAARALSALTTCGVFARRHAFVGLTALCVAVLGGTLWYARHTPLPKPPTAQATVIPALPAGQLPDFVQRLPTPAPDLLGALAQKTPAPTAKPTPTPTPAPDPRAVWPYAGNILMRHSAVQPVWWPTLRQWGTHTGIDIEGAEGESVCAALDGTVTQAYRDSLFGNIIEILHPSGYVSRYAGLKTLSLVRVGDEVKAGQVIASMGKTALCEADQGAHLHFELFDEKGNPKDPCADWLPKR